MANKIKVSANGITVTCDRGDAETYELIKDFYPVHSNRIGTIHSLSIRHLPEVLEKLRGINAGNISTAPQNIQDLWYKEINARTRVQDLLKNGPVESPVVNGHLTLREHQQLGREIAKIRDKYCFFFDTRTGKTPLSLSIMLDDILEHPDHKWLVVCPLILIELAWLPDAAEFIPDLTVVNCHASTKDKRLKAMKRPGNIYVTNTESFAKYKEYFDNMGFHGCIVDESSDMKSHKSNVSNALVDFGNSMKRFYLLSGTPAPNGEWEYFMQLRAIDYYCMPPSYTQFKERYFINISRNVQYDNLVARPDTHDELLSIIKKYAIYVDKEDVLTTPGRTFIEVPLKMPPELRVMYDKMKNELYTEIGEREITVTSAAAKLNKLNQITSGFIIDTKAIKENKFYDDSNSTEWYLLDNYRFEKLKAMLDEPPCRGEQVLLWANYRTEFELIKELLGERCACVYGGTSIAEKNEAVRNFKSGKIQYLVANPASADKGLTLTNAHISIYFSLNWSYELFKQSMERIYGDISKQPKHCLYYVLIADNSIDGVIYHDVLQGKGNASTAILNHLKS